MRAQEGGTLLQCHKCRSFAMGVWSRLIIGAPLPELVPVTDAPAARRADRVDLEIGCMRCCEPLAIYQAVRMGAGS